MLKDENRCHFNLIKQYADIRPGNDYYGYIVDFDHGGETYEESYQGVLAPNMRGHIDGSNEWILFPMWCVEITRQPKEPVRYPSYEVDE